MRLPSATGIALDPSAPMPRAKIEHAAQQLEAQFAQMLIKSMRSASFGDPMMGNTTYREMYDQQLSRELTKGRGLGLAPMIVRQLERSTQAATAPAAPAGGLPLDPPAAAIPLRPSAALAPASATALPDDRWDAPAAGHAGSLTLAPTRSGLSLPAFDLPTVSVSAPSMAHPLATAPADCPPDAPLDCSSPEKFVQSIWPHAQRTAAELGVPAKALVAQAALETGWGRRLVGREGASSHNLFGIKAGGRWNGGRMSAATHEFVNGQRRSERADFRAYGSAADSFADYARLLGNDRYAHARGTGDDTHRFASALQRAGYATDPSYAAKITAIANGATLQRALASLPAAADGQRFADAGATTSAMRPRG